MYKNFVVAKFSSPLVSFWSLVWLGLPFDTLSTISWEAVEQSIFLTHTISKEFGKNSGLVRIWSTELNNVALYTS